MATSGTAAHVLQGRVEQLLVQQKARWDQFCKMADNMKNLSSDMFERGQANKAQADFIA
jgi:hypothetical protein